MVSGAQTSGISLRRADATTMPIRHRISTLRSFQSCKGYDSRLMELASPRLDDEMAPQTAHALSCNFSCFECHALVAPTRHIQPFHTNEAVRPTNKIRKSQLSARGRNLPNERSSSGTQHISGGWYTFSQAQSLFQLRIHNYAPAAGRT